MVSNERTDLNENSNTRVVKITYLENWHIWICFQNMLTDSQLHKVIRAWLRTRTTSNAHNLLRVYQNGLKEHNFLIEYQFENSVLPLNYLVLKHSFTFVQ